MSYGTLNFEKYGEGVGLSKPLERVALFVYNTGCYEATQLMPLDKLGSRRLWEAPKRIPFDQVIGST